MPLVSYHAGLLERLRDPTYAEGYLDEARELGADTYRAALQNVAEAVAMNTRNSIPKNLGPQTDDFYRLLSEQVRQFGRGPSRKAGKKRKPLSAVSTRAKRHPMPAPARAPRRARSPRD